MDYYRVLGVSREASDEDIKKAYRKLVFQHHPDRNPNSTDAEARIREINAAYEIVGDSRSETIGKNIGVDARAACAGQPQDRLYGEGPQ